MLNEAVKVLGDHGWAAVLLFIFGGLLVRFLLVQTKVWKQRSEARLEKEEEQRQAELTNHQFFSNLNYRLNSEIPTLVLNQHQPVRQQLFRKLLEVTLLSLKEVVDDIVAADIEDMSPSQWASFINGELQKIDRLVEEKALRDGMPTVLVNKYIVWKTRSAELLSNYVNDLAISEVYSTNLARTNTLLYLLNLKLITIIGDAERSLMDLNGEISGLSYNGGVIE